MSGGHGHAEHNHGGHSANSGGGMLSAFKDFGGPASQLTSIFGAFFTGILGGGGGGHDHHH